MDASARDRLFGVWQAFDDPMTVMMTVAAAIALALAPLVISQLERCQLIDSETRSKLNVRWRSWLVIVPLILVSILAGAAWTILATGLLSLFAYREYARATGLFREKQISLIVALGIVLITFAALDHWYRLFVALNPLTISVILMVALFADRPQGYIQRAALAVLGYTVLGFGLGHLGFLANDVHYRPLILLVLVAAEANDLFVYLGEKIWRAKPIFPRTDPRKTVPSIVAALVLTAVLVVALGYPIFRGTPLQHVPRLAVLGLLISGVGQLGDLIFSSIKRDLGIKGFDVTIPGHGGLLDRIDSLVPIASVVFHYVNYFNGIGGGQAVRVLTGGPE